MIYRGQSRITRTLGAFEAHIQQLELGATEIDARIAKNQEKMNRLATETKAIASVKAEAVAAAAKIRHLIGKAS